MNKPNLLRSQSGVVLITILILGMILTAVGLSMADLALNQYRRTSDNVFRTNATLVAEAGIERSLNQLNQTGSFGGYGTAQDFFNNSTQGHGTYQTSISSGSGSNEKIIISTGKVYRQGSGSLVGTRKVKVTVVGTQSQGYSVYTGVGGLILGGSANITNSSVFVNGTISLSGAAKIGTNNAPLTVNVANMACPSGANPGSSYPQVCTSTQPISAAWSTAIYGTVCATGQTTTSPSGNPAGNILHGTTGQGLITGCVTPPVSMPTYDRAAHIASMTTTGSGTSNTYVCNSSPFTRNWPAKLKLTGNVSVGSSCDVTVNGNVYITGDLTLGGAAKIRVANSVGATRPVVVVDGKITVGGSGSILANSSGTGIQFISFKSAASCGATCTNVTGTDLYNSKNLETINVGGAASLPGIIFQAYWGKITVGGSGTIGSALGQTVDLSGAGTITFGTSLSSGTSTWTIRSYQQIFN